ncbi:hypothetical protein [Gordoniibacillus kamchatkensis]|uniref:hypothetical protein n=1 Tax=Gordoniibacillus kamchatkensis TaxID=1590651 RepID=UPI00069770FD|nr:hypothetical protein [Paenibacillus sp. VKM B-2647]
MTRDDVLSLCMSHMHRYVGVHTANGAFHDGIVESVDETHLYLAVPIGCEGEDHHRAFFGPYWGGYYPYGYGFSRGDVSSAARCRSPLCSACLCCLIIDERGLKSSGPFAAASRQAGSFFSFAGS